jgi:hypothetical protein
MDSEWAKRTSNEGAMLQQRVTSKFDSAGVTPEFEGLPKKRLTSDGQINVIRVGRHPEGCTRRAQDASARRATGAESQCELNFLSFFRSLIFVGSVADWGAVRRQSADCVNMP